MNYEQLTAMAKTIEEDGFSDVKNEAILKVAESSELLRKLDEDIKNNAIKSKAKKSSKKVSKKKKSGSQLIEEMYSFKKEASRGLFGSRIVDGITQTALVGLGISVAGRMLDNAEKGWDKRQFDKKKPKIIEFAKKENPSLSDVPNSRIGRYLDSAYAVAPRIAKDPLSATAYINTAHAVGGVDLGTQKTLADIQQKGGQSYTGNYDVANSVSGNIMKQMSI